MSNLSNAIEHLGEAQEYVEFEAEITVTYRAGSLSLLADRIRQCKEDLVELAEQE